VSLDEHMFIATLLRDVQSSHSEVYSPREMKLDIVKCQTRISREGLSFLTKTLPRLCKAFNRALQGDVPFDSTGFSKRGRSQLPKFLGGLFERVFAHDGWVLPTPCVQCIDSIRQVCTLFYRYKLPYEQTQEQATITRFVDTEREVARFSEACEEIRKTADRTRPLSRQYFHTLGHTGLVITRARCRLARLFARFNPRNITPSHGPGAVSTRERLWDKWKFSEVSPRIAAVYPVDEYYYSSITHVCDRLQSLLSLKDTESSARVILVPKDSRGPRLISCEPLSFQWIQQGLSRAIVKHVERHPLTRHSVRFTDQRPNQIAALHGSLTGKYATLDLNEASDRVSLGLVRLLFPDSIIEYLEACRSLSTELPNGQVIPLSKYAPMGSALCFPVLALTIWAILTAGISDADARECVLVYGDDVVVPTAYAEYATKLLEAFGLKVNQDKSCTKGFFRESCGTDAFKGVDVTPIYIRTVWSSHRCPHVYSSWISYANSFYDKRYYRTYWYIVDKLLKVYKEIPQKADSCESDLSLYDVPAQHRPRATRTNLSLQKRESRVWELVSRPVIKDLDGWLMLLRYFTEAGKPSGDPRVVSCTADATLELLGFNPAFAVRSYTKRKQVKLVKRWR
jgi:hypothetical protein